MRMPIRQSQLISPWGIGQIVIFPNDESLMVAGLDTWLNEYEKAKGNIEEFIVNEERLQSRLQVSHFRLPPDFRQQGSGVINANIRIPFVRFPRWHYCPRCGVMKYLSIYQVRKQRCSGQKFQIGRSCDEIEENKRKYLIPSRFITLCEKGHIDDFPFEEWVHRGNRCQENGTLRYFIRQSTSALGAVQITCTCGTKRTMAHSFTTGALSSVKKCNGQMPWLGRIDDLATGCGVDLKTAQRGASNVYFPIILSSIYISPDDHEEDEDQKNIELLLQRHWDVIKEHIIKNQLTELKNLLTSLYKHEFEIDAERLIKSARKKMQISNDLNEVSEEEFRKGEYEVLSNKDEVKLKDLYLSPQVINDYGGYIKKYFSRIALVHKLRETRAITGFTRVEPYSGSDYLEMKGTLSLNTDKIDWLPAIIVKGEGIFIEFRQDELDKWASKNSVTNRIDRLAQFYNESGYRYKNVTPQFVLLHSFAHIILNQLSIYCGYNSSSLRERIYCSSDGSMNGILIYTASGDSEGSLGGLVKQGENITLPKIIMPAIEHSKWCSSDPICIQSLGQGPGSCNLAACHNCALISETSCEENNRLLDRGVIIGTLSEPEIGFFGNP